MYRLISYQKEIFEIDPTINPVGVEALMRLEHSTLDSMPASVFRQEVKLAAQCEAEQPGILRSVADSFGELRDFEAAEALVQRG